MVGPPTQGLALPSPDDTGSYGAVPASEGTAAYNTIFDDGYADARFPGTSYRDTGPRSDGYGDASYPGDGYGNDGYDDDEFYDDAYDDEGGEKGRRSFLRLGIILLVVVGLLLAPLLVAGFWVMRQINPSGGHGEPVSIELEGGMTTAEIGDLLHENGVIGSPRVFGFYARFRGEGDIQAGVYEGLYENMSMGDALDVLAGGPDVGEGNATITPGQTVDEMIELLGGVERFDPDELRAALDEVDFPRLPDDVDNPEGMLASGSYELHPDITEQELLQTMADNFDELYGELGVGEGIEPGGDVSLSGYEVVIVASMVEGEALLDEDRPRIARVIYNRLAQGRPLGIDATSCYDADEDTCLTSEVLEGDSPYSTRSNEGLPPTPISTPSEASLEAALNPEEGEWDHYVLDVEAGDGSHLFTDDDQEWAEARDRCREAGECA